MVPHLGRCSMVLARWRHVLFVVGAPMAFFFIDRLLTLLPILDVYAIAPERSPIHQVGGLLLGMVEDLLTATMLFAALLVLEFVAVVLAARVSTKRMATLAVVGRAGRTLAVFMLVVLTVAPFAADMLLVRIREMRFTTDLLATMSREREQATTLEVEPREVRWAIATCIGAFSFAVAFTGVYVRWIDLHRLLVLSQAARFAFKRVASSPREDLESASHRCSDDLTLTDSASSPSDTEDDQAFGGVSMVPTKNFYGAAPARAYSAREVRLVIGWLVLLVVCCVVSHAVGPAVSAIALNATLNELCRNVFDLQLLPSYGSGGISSATYYLQPDTETYELFKEDVLFRKTTGFTGPLEFDVQVEEENPPNVMVLAVESFRHMDSLLMAANTNAGHLMQKNNLTLTPHFDRWASRGIAFNNMWSSWQTSRSLEAILFGQIAYDSVTDSGTTYGKTRTKLVGMPQFFKQKGYETVFTTGCIVTYDQWDSFLPSHGFETVIAAPDMKRIAEEQYNISKEDLDGPAHRGFEWGLHDDLSFEIVGDLMVQKVKDQAERMERGERKKPFFLNHYTISSHHTFDAHPAWLDSEDLPDFSPLCEGFESECVLIKKYAKLRYFTDMELGKFLDRMKAAGVLDDTIVVIVGDHGQSPEMGLANPIVYQTAVTHVASALVAEGRLGEAVGMVFEDATHHYDLLNTLADIVGVPKEGFLQTGVGRSLKRKIPFGQRLVWSNNPMKKMAVIKGYQRFVYDRSSNDMGLFDTTQDPLEKNDLLPSRTNKETEGWFAQREAGRELNAYFRNRWDGRCLAKVSC